MTSILSLLLLFSIPQAAPAPGGSAPVVTKATLPRQLPAFKTPAERAKDSNAQLVQWMTAHPELYGITVPPPADFTMYAEFDPVDTMYLVYDDYNRDYYVDLIEAAAARVDVVLWHSDAQAEIAQILQSRLTPAALARVSYLDFYDTPHYVFTSPYEIDSAVDSIWAVDFGPFFVRNDSGQVAIVDPHYYIDRINDNSIPDKMGDVLGMTVWRPDLNLEGGNFFSDGLGTCYSTTMVHEANPKYTATQIDQIFEDYFGCKKMFWLDYLDGEGTGHIDMFFILASPTDVIVGSFTQSQDATNRAVMDANAALLTGATNFAGDPLTVHRIPMPNPGQDYYGRVWRSYTNGLRLNGGYLVPVFEEHTAYQLDALAVLEAALPGVTPVPVASDSIMPWGGAIHCTTRSKPAGPAYLAATEPDWLCGGAPFCDDCTDECAVDEVGCTGNGDRYLCGNTDLDSCRERIVLSCPASAPCDEGACGGEACTDACLPWEIGCVDDDARFICAEDGDGDYCIDPVAFACGAGRTCSGGVCVPDGGACGDITYDGECQGDVSVWCEEGELIAYDCTFDGMTCGYLQSEGYYDCVDFSACTDACELGATRCAEGNLARQACAEAFDGDRCLEWKTIDCEAGTECRDGACVTPCTDACTEGEVACADEDTLTTCTRNTTTGCTELVPAACEAGLTCRGDACVAPKKADDGCSCATGSRSPSSPAFPSFLLLLGLAGWFIRRRAL